MAVCGFADSSIKLWDLYSNNGEDGHHSAAVHDFPVAVQRPLQATTSNLARSSSLSPPASFSVSSPKAAAAAATAAPTTTASTRASRPSYGRLLGHSGAVFGLGLSADQRFLLSSSEDSTIRLWHTDTARNIVAYKGHTSTVWDVAFSPLSQHFASAAQYDTQHSQHPQHSTTQHGGDPA